MTIRTLHRPLAALAACIVAASGVVLTPATAHAASAPTISVSPSRSADLGTRIRITGTGWTPGDRVSIGIDYSRRTLGYGQTLAAPVADPDGGIDTIVDLPAPDDDLCVVLDGQAACSPLDDRLVNNDQTQITAGGTGAAGDTAAIPFELTTPSTPEVPRDTRGVLLGQGIAQVLDGGRKSQAALAWTTDADEGVPTSTVKTPAGAHAVGANDLTYSASKSRVSLAGGKSVATSGPVDFDALVTPAGSDLASVAVAGTGVSATVQQRRGGATPATSAQFGTLTIDAASHSLSTTLDSLTDITDVSQAVDGLADPPAQCVGLGAPTLPATITAAPGVTVSIQPASSTSARIGALHVDVLAMLRSLGIAAPGDTDAIAALRVDTPQASADLALSRAMDASANPIATCADALRDARPAVAQVLDAAAQRLYDSGPTIDKAVTQVTHAIAGSIAVGLAVTGHSTGVYLYKARIPGTTLTSHLREATTAFVRAVEVTSLADGTTEGVANAAAGVDDHGGITVQAGGGTQSPKPHRSPTPTPRVSTTPPPTTTKHTPPGKPTPSQAVSPPLANTGSQTGQLLGVAGLLLVVGVLAMFAGRKRRRAAHRA